MEQDTDMPPLPAFLDRKTWTDKQWASVEQRRKEAQEAALAEIEAIRCRAKEIKEANKAKAAMEAQRQEEKKAILEKREAKRLLKLRALHAVQRAFDKQPRPTANTLRRIVADEFKPLVPYALRTMLKSKEIERVSRQTYKRRSK